jgi:ABC-2 type transport system permease protein
MSARVLFTIARRELKAYFLSPIAYIVGIVFLVATGWFFFSVFFLQGRADLRSFFTLLPLVFSLVIPAITMRLLSEEFAIGTYETLITLPVATTDVLVGKFLAALCFVIVMVVPTVSYPIFVSAVGDLDWGPVLGGYVGTILLAALYCAIGVFASALSKNQIVAFIIGIALCGFLTLIDKVLVLLPRSLTDILQFIGADYHFQNVARGVLDSRDIVYFVSVTFLALFATKVAMDEQR